MSRENVGGGGPNAEAVRAGFEAFNSRDDDAWLGLWHRDAELHELTEIPDAAVYRGHDGIRAWIANVRTLVGEFRFEPRQVHDHGETVVAEVAASGTGAGSGVPLEWTAYIVFNVRNGKVMKARGFLSRDEALAAAGLVE